MGERPCRWERLAGRRGERQPQLLEAARHPDRPALVTEVPFDLADDGRRGVGGELDPALVVEAVHRLDQADGGDLGQVVQRLAPVAEPPGQVLDQRDVHPHQLVAQLDALRGAVGQRGQPDEQRAGRLPVRCARAVRGRGRRLGGHRGAQVRGLVRRIGRGRGCGRRFRRRLGRVAHPVGVLRVRIVVGGEARNARLGRYGRSRRREAGTVQITHGHSPVPFREHRGPRAPASSRWSYRVGGGTGRRPRGP